MKYLVRFLGATILYPFLYCYVFLFGIVLASVLFSLWHLKIVINPLHFTKEDSYFVMDKQDWIMLLPPGEEQPYKLVYKNPKDMLFGKLTKILL